MRVVDEGNALRFVGYPFRTDAVRRPIPAERLLEILPRRFPPEVWLRDGEILFAAHSDLETLVAFADRHRIPLTDREDVWALLVEDCLDTEHDDDWKRRTRDRLRELGFSDDEVKALKARTNPRLMAWNAFAWEWVHLGHLDMLRAHYGPLGRIGAGRFPRLYRDSMGVAARAPRRPWDEAKFRSDLEACFRPALYARWKAAWDALGVPAPPGLYRRIVEAYGAPGRFYHDVGHLEAVVGALADDGASPLVQLAGWFHDFCDPSKAGAEEASAFEAEKALGAALAAPSAARVAELVRTTANHWAKVGNDPDARALAAADLWILGAPPDRYRSYALGVRLEYRRVPWLLFRHGRMRFLKKALALAEAGRLGFRADAAWEKQAAENLRAELCRWRRFRGP